LTELLYVCIIDRYTVVTNGSHRYITKTTKDIHGNYWFLRKNYMGIRQIHGSIGKEMINGKFYSMPQEQYNQIFGKKNKKTKENSYVRSNETKKTNEKSKKD